MIVLPREALPPNDFIRIATPFECIFVRFKVMIARMVVVYNRSIKTTDIP